MKSSVLRRIIFVLIATGLVGIAAYQMQERALDGGVTELKSGNGAVTILKKPVTVSANNGANAQGIGGAFSLVDQDGKAVTDEDYAGSYKLIFFGFTYCPSVCPTELQKMTLVMNQLGDKAKKIIPIFITVDPERDTPEQVKSYIAHYHPKMVGLTGTPEQIDAVEKSFHVYAKKIKNEFMDGYMMDHSSYTYLMGPNDELVAIYPVSDSAQDIIADIERRDF